MDLLRKEQKRVISWSGFSLFIMAAVVFLVQLLLELIISLTNPVLFKTDWLIWVETAITVSGIGAPVFIAFISRIPDREHREIKKLTVSQFFVIFFICVAAMYLTNYLSVFLTFIISLIKGESVLNPMYEAAVNSNLYFMFGYGALIAPVMEELMFRKFLLGRLRRFGDLPAIIFSGVAFGLFHMNLSQFFYAAALGMIFAYVVIQTNTVRYTILLHIMINAIGVAATPIALKQDNIGLLMIMAIWVITSISVGAVFFALNIKKIKFNKSDDNVLRKRDYLLNTGTILFILICVAHIIYITFFA